MKKNRREFIKKISQSGITAVAGSKLIGNLSLKTEKIMEQNIPPNDNQSLSGPYGIYFSSITNKSLPSHSFRRSEWKNISKWKKSARELVLKNMAIPDLGNIPAIKIIDQYTYDGLQVQEIEYQLPYGNPTKAIILKPLKITGKLPSVLALHDHGGNKYFGHQKLIHTGKETLIIKEVQNQLYEGRAWANELARKGYIVMVSDAFSFGNRRVLLSEVPPHLSKNLKDPIETNHDGIRAYNSWAGDHEHILSKSLLSAGTTWPGVFFAEDKMALNILATLPDVDTNALACAGLSGGGLRTVLLGGLDDRIKCAVCVGFMTTWEDLALYKCHTHTWMSYIPLVPKALDFPEILSLRVPLPTLVLNDNEDSLFTLSHMHRADEIMRAVFQKANASDHYRCSFYPGPHKFDIAMQIEAFDWLDKWLKRG